MSTDHVKKWQMICGVTADGDFGPTTLAKSLEVATKAGVYQPAPAPVQSGSNPFTVKSHLLYKGGSQVSYKLTPNLSAGTIEPELIVIHYTGDNSFQGALSWLTAANSQVSAHLIITKEGVVWQLAPFNRRAWHAGSSSWNGRSDCNSWSIGIENVGLGDEWPEAQIVANIQVCQALIATYGIEEVVGHVDVAPGRKVDPGPKYPWKRVREALGI